MESFYLRTINHPTITHVQLTLEHKDGFYHATAQPIHRPTAIKIGDKKSIPFCEQKHHNKYAFYDALDAYGRAVEQRIGEVGSMIRQVLADHSIVVMEGTYT